MELSTLGDLKLVERPSNNTLAPNVSKVLRANIKVGLGLVAGGGVSAAAEGVWVGVGYWGR